MLVTERTFAAVMESLRTHPRLVVDTETNGLHTWRGSRLIGVSVAPPNATRRECYYFPFRHLQGGNLSLKRLKQLLEMLQTKILTGWHLKFDLHMFYADGMEEPPETEEVMLLFHLLDENQWKTGGTYELKVAACRYIDPHAADASNRLTQLLADRGLDKGDLDKLSPLEVDDYASDDAYLTERMRAVLLPGAREWELERIWREVSRYSVITGHSAHFEGYGFQIDVALANRYIKECERKQTEFAIRLCRWAGREVNPGSHQQMRAWLKLPSTAEEYLDQINLTGNLKEIVDSLQSWRKWNRAKGSYYAPFIANSDGDGVFHPNILLHGTISGRPSARGTPNVFAIPRYTEIYKVKDVVVARKGFTLVSADYSQAELRLGAHYSHDEFNIKCFNEGKSPHKLLLADLTEKGVVINYDDTKRVSFAVMYGTGAPTLSKELKKSIPFTKGVLKEAHALHPNYRPMLAQTEEIARRLGYIRLWTGRVRRFNTLNDPRPWWHKACSNLIQGGVGEIMRVAIDRLFDALDANSHMLLQVYDQILFEVPTELVKQEVKVIEQEMTRDFPFSVPLAVEIKVGKRWGQLKEAK